jgi:hypothetical protein
VRRPNAFLVLPILFSVWLPEGGELLAYGPAPGMELIPYFLALLGWVGLAFAAIVMAPLSALLRRLRRARGTERKEPETASTPEPSDESRESA